MMTTPAIQPTITQRVRGFLAAQGVTLRPWSGLDETYTELYGLLYRRRSDPAFWPHLTELLHAVVDDAVDPTGRSRLPARQAELLRSWDITDLVSKLRGALPREAPKRDPGAVRSFAVRLSSAVLGGFLLLGVAAAGCDSGDANHNNNLTGGDAGADAAVVGQDAGPGADAGAWHDGCSLNSGSILWNTLDDATISADEKRTLCGCFASLNVSWTDGLSQLFSTGTPQQIAAALAEMVECCSFDEQQLDGDYQDAEAEFLQNTWCEPAVIYKGVAFPRRQL
ncbi:MAG: hypothetical protein ABI333_07460 [bacterium]